MTFCFIQAIERSGPGATYGTILTAMRTAIKNAGSSGGGSGGGDVVTSLLSMLLTGGSLTAGGLRQVNIQLKLSYHISNLEFELFPFHAQYDVRSYSSPFMTPYKFCEYGEALNFELTSAVYCFSSPFLFQQEPQLTAGEAFDVYRKPFSL